MSWRWFDLECRDWELVLKVQITGFFACFPVEIFAEMQNSAYYKNNTSILAIFPKACVTLGARNFRI
jgi:hypothetical protein